MERESLKIFEEALAKLEQGFASLPGHDDGVDVASLRPVLMQVAERLQDNFPYHHPLYAGQMLKPPHAVARLSYWLAMFINPNNHALDGGRASSAMEKEAVSEIAAMFGFTSHLGHLASSGTIANLEALWIASQERDGVILASEQAHYTHSRISGVLRLPFESIPVDRFARMNLDALEGRLKKGGVSTIVATLGTTAAGAVDPLHEILPLAKRHGVRVHVDSAYGGISMGTRARHSTRFRRRIPSSSIRTSMGCNPTVAAACCLRTRRSAGITGTTRRTRISVPMNCILARSVSSVRARAQRRSRSGQPRNCCRL